MIVLDTINTHLGINKKFVGTAISVSTGISSTVHLLTDHSMLTDDHGLVHGGFTFGLADYAAMLAVNEPNVVLASAEVSFLAPVKNGDVLVATATVQTHNKNKWVIETNIKVDNKMVFTGIFTCFVLSDHVLSIRK